MPSPTIAILALLVILAILTFWPLWRLLNGDSGGEVGVRGRWGGFGGGRGGWQFTRGLTLLLLTIFFGSAFGATGGYLIYVTHQEASSEERVKLLEKQVETLEKMLTEARNANSGFVQPTQVPPPEKPSSPNPKSLPSPK